MTPGGAAQVDAVVVGAGTAGLGAAVQLARIGLRVAVLERRCLADGGARWVNGVLRSQFDRCDLPFPFREHPGAVTHLLGPGTSGRIAIADSPVVDADMRELTGLLRDEAAERGVALWERAEVPTLEWRAGRPRAVALRAAVPGGDPAPLRLEAPLFVDASGRAGVLRRQHPELDPWCPTLDGTELCTASQYTHAIADTDGARRFLEEHGARAGDGVTRVGFAGGFSALAIHVSGDLDQVGVLTGTLATGRWGTGRTILEQARADHPWIGEPRFGGSGLIPLRRPPARFTAPGLALVGDAASQVFPAHGSGIGFGLIAGRVLAESVAGAADPGDPAVLWRYQSDYQRVEGATLTAYDGMRRLTSTLGGEGVARMFSAGFFDPATAVAGLAQAWDPPAGAQLADRVRALGRDRALAARLLPGLARSAAARSLHRWYPEEPDLVSLGRWERAVRRTLPPLHPRP